MTPSSIYRRLACLSPLFRDQWEKLEERHMGIEPILSAWKAEVLAIIRMAQVSALDSLSAINKMVTINKLLLAPKCGGGAGIRTLTFRFKGPTFRESCAAITPRPIEKADMAQP